MPTEKNVESPEQFMEMWEEYKALILSEPETEEIVTQRGVVVTKSMRKPFLRCGFEAWVYKTKGFHIHQYFDNYDNNYEEYLGVTTCVRREWEEDQISGTLTGRYKSPNLVARMNNLTDKQDLKMSGEVKVITGMEIK